MLEMTKLPSPAYFLSSSNTLALFTITVTTAATVLFSDLPTSWLSKSIPILCLKWERELRTFFKIAFQYTGVLRGPQTCISTWKLINDDKSQRRLGVQCWD